MVKKILFMNVIFAFLLSFSSGNAEEIKWEVAGAYAETCTCEVGCPCIFKSPPSHGTCDASLFFHVKKGLYGQTSLDGLTFTAAASLGPEGSVAFYVDENASAEQRKALEAIFKPMLKEIAPKDLGTKYVSIKVNSQGDTRELNIPDILDFKIERVTGMLPDAPNVVSNPPFHFLPELIVAKSIRYHYKDHGQDWNYSGRSGLYGNFHYTSSAK